MNAIAKIIEDWKQRDRGLRFQQAMQAAHQRGLDNQKQNQALDQFCDSHCTWTTHHPDCAIGQWQRGERYE